jgi:putative transposase
MNKGVKFRAYPNKEQQNLINRTFGCCRLVYNKGLDMRNTTYETGGKPSFGQTSAMLPQLKRTEEFSFLKEVDSIALQQSLRDLDRAFVNFFQKRARHPVFKSKHDTRQSYRTINQGDNIRIDGSGNIFYAEAIPDKYYDCFDIFPDMGHTVQSVSELCDGLASIV